MKIISVFLAARCTGVSSLQLLEATMAITRDRERQRFGLASDDTAERVACDAPASIAIDVVRGPVAEARFSLGSHWPRPAFSAARGSAASCAGR